MNSPARAKPLNLKKDRAMYKAFQRGCERILRIPAEPEAPPGDESTARIFRAAPNFFRYLMFLWALASAVSLLVLSVALLGPVAIAISQMQKRGNHSGYLLLFIPAIALALYLAQRLFSLAVMRLNFEKRWYIVTDRSIRIREGVLDVREMTITFANIQNISISQGPIQRALGIADLQVDTAGGGASGGGEGRGPGQNLHTGWLRGINNANEVRELIQSRIKHLKDAGLGDRDDAQHHPAATLPSSPEFLAALAEVHLEAQKLARALSPS